MLSRPASPVLDRYREERALPASLQRLEREGEILLRNIKAVFAVSIIALSLGMSTSISFAQDASGDLAGPGTYTVSDDNEGFDLGGIGLAGLAGLLGLMPRDRHRRDHDLNR